MKVTETELPGVLLIELDVFGDARGSFLEIFRQERYAALGLPSVFAQDNLSRSVRGVLRGLHFQEPRPQGKLVQVLSGVVFDVVVDIRRGSPTFRRWTGIELDGRKAQQLWVPPGFAHGFCVLSETADFLYKCTDAYVAAADRCIRWDDPELGIKWPSMGTAPILSAKDLAAPTLAEAPMLPTYIGP